jgi:hypothetical protein
MSRGKLLHVTVKSFYLRRKHELCLNRNNKHILICVLNNKHYNNYRSFPVSFCLPREAHPRKRCTTAPPKLPPGASCPIAKLSALITKRGPQFENSTARQFEPHHHDRRHPLRLSTDIESETPPTTAIMADEYVSICKLFIPPRYASARDESMLTNCLLTGRR